MLPAFLLLASTLLGWILKITEEKAFIFLRIDVKSYKDFQRIRLYRPPRFYVVLASFKTKLIELSGGNMLQSLLVNWLPVILILGLLLSLGYLASKLIKRIDRALPDSNRKQ